VNELTLPGGTTVPASAITAVTVLPTHRRRGILRRMMAADLDASIERGEPLAILIASEYPIYGRYGFGRSADHVRLGVDARSARFVRAGGGSVELVQRDLIRELGPALYERFRLARPGSILRPGYWWDQTLGIVEAIQPPPKGIRYVLHRDERGAPQGYLRYHVDEKWDDRQPASTLVVDELLSCTDEAYARLWRFACEVDLIATVRAEDRPPDEALPWLLEDGRAVQQLHRTDFLWVRLLDPPAALGARRYMAPGRIVLDVQDEAGYAAGRFALETGLEGASCRRTRETADITLDVQALGSLYLGGFSLRALVAAGRATEERPGAVDRADAAFGWNVAPWCSTWF
jgi:predicted acetyltransferase